MDAKQSLILLLTIALGTYSDDIVERTITTTTEWNDGRCCMKNCLDAETDVACQEWKDSILEVNKKQAAITEERVARIEALYDEVVELRANAAAMRVAKLEEARKSLNESWNMKKAMMKKELDAEFERFRSECVAAYEKTQNQAETTAHKCNICGTTDLEGTTTDSPATYLHETTSSESIDDTATSSSVNYREAGWINISEIYWYKIFTEKLDQATASSRCGGFGGRLASAAIRDDVLKSDIISTADSLNSVNVWIGLTDIEEEGVWKWSDGVKGVDEIEVTGGTIENCARLSKYRSVWLIRDMDCSMEYDYACEVATGEE